MSPTTPRPASTSSPSAHSPTPPPPSTSACASPPTCSSASRRRKSPLRYRRYSSPPSKLQTAKELLSAVVCTAGRDARCRFAETSQGPPSSSPPPRPSLHPPRPSSHPDWQGTRLNSSHLGN